MIDDALWESFLKNGYKKYVSFVTTFKMTS